MNTLSRLLIPKRRYSRYVELSLMIVLASTSRASPLIRLPYIFHWALVALFAVQLIVYHCPNDDHTIDHH